MLAQGESSSIDKLRSLIEALISDAVLRDIISECYKLWERLIKIGRENGIYQLGYFEWLPIKFIRDLKYVVYEDLTNRAESDNKS